MTATKEHPLSTYAARRRFNKSMRTKGVPARVCSSCHVVKGHPAFAADRKSPDGRNATCRACYAERHVTPEYREYERKRRQDPAVREYRRECNADYRESNRSRPLDIGDGHLPKRCTTVAAGGCERLLVRGDFPRKRSRADQRDPLCRECVSRRDAERHLRHKLRLLDRWEETGDLDCYLCGLPVAEGQEWQVEHVTPQSAGGPDEPWNLLLAHRVCNAGPGGKFTDPALAAWARIMTAHGHDVPALATLADRLAARSGGVVDMATGEILEDWSLADAVATV